MSAAADRRRIGLRTRLEHFLDSRSVALAVWVYRRSHGRVARLYRRNVLVLTTTGRRTGKPRTVVVQYFLEREDMVVVAANSGMPTDPAWYLNLMAEPRARVEVDGRVIEVSAEPLTREAAAAFWPRVLEAAPDYSRFTARTDRPLPLVRLSPVAGERPVGTAARPEDRGIYRSVADRRAVLDEYDRIASEWPVDHRDLDIDTHFGTTHVIESGRVDGTPVVLLHAASMAAISWAPNVAALVGAGHRVFAIDHPGEANRSVLADRTRYPATDVTVVAHYRDVLEELGIHECALVGASAGGQRALRVALALPDRVDRLALLGPMGLTHLGPGAVARMTVAAMHPTPRRIRATAEWALGSAPAVTERYGRWFARAVASVAPPPPVARPTAIPVRLLRTLSVRTLVALGDRDRLVGPPGRAARRAASIPGVSIQVMASGHLVNVEQAAAVNRLLVEHLRR
jgi:deazaflavin-dependent oxidoreductase (nitroreductase family)